MKKLAILLFAVFISGCMSAEYRKTQTGKFEGALDVRWVENDYFVFIPNKLKPLKFTRSDGKQISPGKMYTDGGSIPRVLWGVKGYSPWGYAPAYMIHDWLFEAQHCGHSPDNKYEFKDSVIVMAESLKTIMEGNVEVKNNFVFSSVVSAVSTPIARRLWGDGKCKPVDDSEFDKNLEENSQLIDTVTFE